MRRLSRPAEEVMCVLVMLQGVPNGEILSGRITVGRDGVGSFVEVHCGLERSLTFQSR